MMNRFRTILAIAALLGCLGIRPLGAAPAKDDAITFSSHTVTVTTVFNRDGKPTYVIHEDMWRKTPGIFYIENDYSIEFHNGHESWAYLKRQNVYRKQPVYPTLTFLPDTVDRKMQNLRLSKKQIVIKETPGDPKTKRLPVVEIDYLTRGAGNKDSKVHERITLVDEKTRLMNDATVETWAPDGTHLAERAVITYDYTPLADDRVFTAHTPPADAVWE